MEANGDCTVFNRIYHKETREYTWQKTILYGVIWQGGLGVRLMKNGLKEDKETTVFIPMEVKKQSTYKKPKAFEQGGVGTFTLRPEDRLVRGAILEEVGQEELFRAYDDVITITAVDTYDHASPELCHWEVRGR